MAYARRTHRSTTRANVGKLRHAVNSAGPGGGGEHRGGVSACERLCNTRTVGPQRGSALEGEFDMAPQ